mgnify:CR=1 FL=1
MSGARTMECPLAADGRPIVPGETLRGQDGVPWRITAVGPTFSYGASKRGADRRLRNEWLTHEPPDSWERLLADLRATATVCSYFGHDQSCCDGCVASGENNRNCLHAVTLDVARRVEALRKRDAR